MGFDQLVALIIAKYQWMVLVGLSILLNAFSDRANNEYELSRWDNRKRSVPGTFNSDITPFF